MAINVLMNNSDIDTSGTASVIPPDDRGPATNDDAKKGLDPNPDNYEGWQVKKGGGMYNTSQPATKKQKKNTFTVLILLGLIVFAGWKIYNK